LETPLAEVLDLASQLIAAESRRRSVAFSEIVRQEESSFAARNLLRSGLYRDALYARARAELEERSESYWQHMASALTTGRVLWSADVAREVVSRLNSAIESNATSLAGVIREAIVRYGHGVLMSDFDRDASAMKENLKLKVQLFGLGRKPCPAVLEELLSSPRYCAVSEHFRKARQFIELDTPDCANGAKEAISAVEAMAQLLIADASAPFGKALDKIATRQLVPRELIRVLRALWSSTNEANGVRHGSATLASITEPEALFVLETSEAAVRLFLHLDRPA